MRGGHAGPLVIMLDWVEYNIRPLPPVSLITSAELMENKIHTNRKYNIKYIQLDGKWDGMGGEISATDNAILLVQILQVCRQNELIYAYICACVRLMGQASYINLV